MPTLLNPANDRKPPYTDKELKHFAQGFMESLGGTAALQDLINRVGATRTEETIIERFKAEDQNRLEGMTIEGVKQ